MNEGAGDTAFDLGGNTHHGTITGAEWTPGPCGPVLDFPDAGDHINVGDLGLSGLTDVTVLASVNAGKTSTTSDEAIIGQWTLTDLQMLIWLDAGHDVWEAIFYDSGTSLRVENTGAAPIDGWQHIAVVLRGENLKMYLNAELVASNDQNGFPGIAAGGGTDIYIGASNESGVARPFTGLIDNVSVYNRALTSSEVTSLYADPYQMFHSSTPQAVWASFAEASTAGYMTLNSFYWG